MKGCGKKVDDVKDLVGVMNVGSMANINMPNWLYTHFLRNIYYSYSDGCIGLDGHGTEIHFVYVEITQKCNLTQYST
jgi:hypothetical protein